jgi:hypothetical protein
MPGRHRLSGRGDGDRRVAEILLGLRRDPVYGVTLTLGMGGVTAEVLADTVTLVLPATEAEVLTPRAACGSGRCSTATAAGRRPTWRRSPRLPNGWAR